MVYLLKLAHQCSVIVKWTNGTASTEIKPSCDADFIEPASSQTPILDVPQCTHFVVIGLCLTLMCC